MQNLKLAIAGLGAIGLKVARTVDAGGISGITLVAVAARDAEKARGNLSGFRNPPPLMGLGDLAAHADVVVECLPSAVFAEVAVPKLDDGRAQAKARTLCKKTKQCTDGGAAQRQHGAVAEAFQNACQIHCVPQ